MVVFVCSFQLLATPPYISNGKHLHLIRQFNWVVKKKASTANIHANILHCTINFYLLFKLVKGFSSRLMPYVVSYYFHDNQKESIHEQDQIIFVVFRASTYDLGYRSY